MGTVAVLKVRKEIQAYRDAMAIVKAMRPCNQPETLANLINVIAYAREFGVDYHLFNMGGIAVNTKKGRATYSARLSRIKLKGMTHTCSPKSFISFCIKNQLEAV